MAFFETRPVSMMMPIRLKMLSVLPVIHRPPSAPIMASGSESKTMNG